MRPTRPLLLAAATATVLSVTSLAAPALAEDGGTDAPTTSAIGLTDGTLDWGVKESFRRYISGPIAGGSITVADGAETNDDGGYRFTEGTGTYDPTTHAVDTGFDGSVHFLGHGGELDLKLAELRVVTEGTTGSIVADVTVAGTTTEDVEFASLDLSAVAPGRGEGGAMVFEDIPATLTEDGAEAFEYHGTPMYQPGTALDAATLTVTPVAEEPEEPEEPGAPEEPGTPEQPGTPQEPEQPGAPEGPQNPAPEEPENPEDPGTQDPDTQDPDTSGTVQEGRLDWGVKESFRSYVTGPIAGGDVELSGGATEIADGYRFPAAGGEFDPEAPALDAEFTGGVRFLGHEGALDLRFSELAIEIDGTEGELIADVSSKDRTSGEVTEYDALTVAELDIPADALNPVDDVLTLDAVPATLTADGAEAFGGFYSAGEELDPVTVTVALVEGADLGDDNRNDDDGDDTGGPSTQTGARGGATGGALASTGASGDLPAALGTAAALTAIGALAYGATRRRLTPES
ncbi:HtaA domain-containing protein [Streptomyces millisiae]|uniref:HtaA domain-containing protein n=1 Tax=Streptomyces millisiae TaxID=3075542 RepID=A0ABU2LWV6_9ACTN|nr:HtaA domain-containing protein [Streptomyces sp. DSM 44918]MDT0322067.1 HtaA domain-containing protein [Streptomyces sp. DSM 44918]